MFNPQHLLGQLLGDAVSGQLGGSRRRGGGRGLGSLLGSGLSTGGKAAVGLGLLGMAVAAFEHFSQQGSTPAPLAATDAGARATPPPPPPPAAAVVPPPPPAHAMPPALDPINGENALLLLRAMIAAAQADGLIDDQERGAIVGRARAAGFDGDTLQALDAEIRAPLTLEQLAARTPPALREEVYAAALIAISADTEQERRFLDRLAGELTLDAAARAGVHHQLGVR